MLLESPQISLETLLGVGTVVAAVIGIGVSFRLFVYRIARLEEQQRSGERATAENAAEIQKLNLWRAQQRGAEKARRGQSIEDTLTFHREKP